MTNYLNRVRHVVETTGTGSSIELAAAADGGSFFAMTDHGTDGATYNYMLTEGTDVEIHEGETWDEDTLTFTRGTPVASKIGGVVGTSKIDLSGSARLRVFETAGDMQKVLSAKFAQTFDAGEKTQLQDNLGASTVGKALLTAADAAEAREAIDAVGYVADSGKSDAEKLAARTNIGAHRVTDASPVTLTNQTQVNFGSIPAGTFKIELMFSGVSMNSTDVPVLFLGTSAGLSGTGYLGTTVATGASGTTAATQWSTSAALTTSLGAGSNFSGDVTLKRLNGTTNKWSITVHNALGDATFTMIGAGSKSLADVLTQIQIQGNGTTQFDAGEVSARYSHP